MNAAELEVRRVVNHLGEELLRYLLAIGPDDDVADALSRAGAHISQLKVLLDEVTYLAQDERNVVANLVQRLGSHRQELGRSLAVYLHECAGGRVAEPPETSDPVVRSLLPIVSDSWPALLLGAPKNAPRAFWVANATGGHYHPLLLEAIKAFLADESLAKLFPHAQGVQDAASIDELRDIDASWVLNNGNNGNAHLVFMADTVIFNAVVLAGLGGEQITHTAVMSAVSRVVEMLRGLAECAPVAVPVVVGIRGASVPLGCELKLADGTLRRIRPIEEGVLLHQPEMVTAVLETTFPLQLLDVTIGASSERGPSEYFQAAKRHTARVEDDSRAFQKRVDRIRLALLLASQGDELLTSNEVSRFCVDPTKPGGQPSWGTASLEGPANYTIPEERIEPVLRYHSVLCEKHPDSLDVAMRRILRAVSERLDPTDAFIDAVVVWENAFGSQSETTFRVTAAIAKLLEPVDADRRLELQRELRRLYSERSKIVHGAREQKSLDAWKSSQRAITVAIDVLRALYGPRSDLLNLDSTARGPQLLLGS